MNILLVILHADSSRGGAELYTVTLFCKLREAGHDVKIAAATFEDRVEPQHRVQLAHDGLFRMNRYASFLRSLDAAVVEKTYDIVHAMLPSPCDVYHPHAGVEAVAWNKASPLRRLTNQRTRMYMNIERSIFGQARPKMPSMLCLSNHARAEAAAIYPAAAGRMVTLYSAVDDQRFIPVASESANATCCLFIGHDFERKGLDIAIRAIATSPKYSLRVVGRDDPTKYRALAASLGISDCVTFAGPSFNIAQELAQAGTLLLPARREPFGMVVPEAMLMGVPPIVSAHAGASEIVRDGIDGRAIAGEDPAAWARAINDVLADRDRYSAACLSRRQELSYSHHLSTLIGIYERIVRERRA